MSFRDYLHEKAEESRHNETVAYLMFLAGTVFFVGGLLETLVISSLLDKIRNGLCLFHTMLKTMLGQF